MRLALIAPAGATDVARVDHRLRFSIFGEPGEKAGLLSRSIEYLFERIERHENASKVRAMNEFKQ